MVLTVSKLRPSVKRLVVQVIERSDVPAEDKLVAYRRPTGVQLLPSPLKYFRSVMESVDLTDPKSVAKACGFESHLADCECL